MGQYLIDNNIVSGFFSEVFSESAMIFLSEVIDLTPNISIITQIEALSWINADKRKEAIVKSFINDCNILQLSDEVV